MEKSNPSVSESNRQNPPIPPRSFLAGYPWLILSAMAIIALVGARGWHLWVAASSDCDRLLVEVDSLRHELKESGLNNLYDDLRIFSLESNPEGSGKALLAWSQRNQKGVLEILNLSPGQSYELWIEDTDRAEPVNGGTFLPESKGTLRAPFFPSATLKNPVAFNFKIGDQLILSSSDFGN